MRTFVALSVVISVVLLAPARAFAHFTLDGIDDASPVCWLSQDKVGGPQKNGPCAATPNTSLGDVMGTPTGIVTGVMAGETVKIHVTATVSHPGWYRVALVEGASASQSLTTLPDPMAMQGTNCTPAIMTNPVWSKTQPVIADGLPPGSTAKTMQTGSVTLQATVPSDANCTMASPCTLQVIMVMTDHPANDCYYHHCADITIGGGSGGGMDAGMSMDASPDAGMSTGTGGAGGGQATGGATGSGGDTGSGGKVGSGGVTGSGGATGSGGKSASGGATGSGGETGSGGALASGGSRGSGGSHGSGGASNPSSTGGATSSGSGGASTSGAASSSGGCSAVPGTGGTSLLGGLALLLMLALGRARRRG